MDPRCEGGRLFYRCLKSLLSAEVHYYNQDNHRMIFSIFSPMIRRTGLIAIGQCRLLAAECAPNFRACGELLKGGGSMVHPWVSKSHSVLGDNAVTARSRTRGDKTEGEHGRSSSGYHCFGSLGGPRCAFQHLAVVPSCLQVWRCLRYY